VLPVLAPNIIIDLERIGDHAEGIANIALMIGDEPPLKTMMLMTSMTRFFGSYLPIWQKTQGLLPGQHGLSEWLTTWSAVPVG